MRQDAAGYLNDPKQAKRVVLEGKEPNRRCRWCDSTMVRVPAGAVICGGFCDMPSTVHSTEEDELDA